MSQNTNSLVKQLTLLLKICAFKLEAETNGLKNTTSGLEWRLVARALVCSVCCEVDIK